MLPMNAEIDSAESLFAIKATIIYEDFPSGLRAKGFAERLAEQLGCGCQFWESIWPLKMLEFPTVAAEAARSAADSAYLIVALSGERMLPRATLNWIDAQLDGAAARGLGLIALLASCGSRWDDGECARRQLLALCGAHGVPFFSHAGDAADGGCCHGYRFGRGNQNPTISSAPAPSDARGAAVR